MKKPNNYWKDFGNVRTELEQIIQKLGHFPSSNELYELGKSSLHHAISRHHGGASKVRELMGHEQRKEKPNNYWKDFTNVKTELEQLIQELGHFPSGDELRELGKSSLNTAISRYHGGASKVRELMGFGVAQIKEKQEFLDLLAQDQTARNLAAASVMLNGDGYDIEKILEEVYEGKFKDQESLHKLLEESTNEIYDLIQNGMTNLGYYVGNFSIQDRAIIPVLLGEVITSIPEDKITSSLEERLVRILRANYGPRFNEDPTWVVDELKEKIDSSQGNKRRLYQTLESHYSDVIRLMGEL